MDHVLSGTVLTINICSAARIVFLFKVCSFLMLECCLFLCCFAKLTIIKNKSINKFNNRNK